MTFRQRLARFATRSGTTTTVLLVFSAVVGVRGLVSLVLGLDDGSAALLVVSAVNLVLGAAGAWLLLRARRDGRRGAPEP